MLHKGKLPRDCFTNKLRGYFRFFKITMKCIYCLEDKKKSEFQHREHVIPQCYGSFSPHNLILRNTVCDDCNQYFGENLELYLGRDTIEGILRYKHGMKPTKEPKKHSRLRIEVLDNDIKGMIGEVKYSSIIRDVLLSFKEQVGFFQKEKREYIYFDIEDIPSAEQLNKDNFDIRTSRIELIYNKKEGPGRIIEKLRRKGIDFIPMERASLPKTPLEREKINVKVTGRIDPPIMRGIAKIAFNYFSLFVDRQFVLMDVFNGIREYIRYGKGKNIDYFRPIKASLIRFDDDLSKQMRKNGGHFLMLNTQDNILSCILGFFINNTYLVWLTRKYPKNSQRFDIKYYFDLTTRKIFMLLPKMKE